MHRVIAGFAARTGVPVVVNTSLNTAGRPMVDDPRDALECLGSAPVDLLAIGPFAVRRAAPPRPRRFGRRPGLATAPTEAVERGAVAPGAGRE
jgi:hypothetical protein